MASFAESAVAGYELGSKIGTDIAEGNILRDVYQGAKPEDMTPEQLQGVNQKAAALAGSKGLGSLQHMFLKESQDLSKAAGEQQLNKLTTQLKSLDVGSRIAKNAQTKEDLFGALDAAGLDTNTKMIIRGQLQRFQKPDGTYDIAGARKMVTDLGTSEAQDLGAKLKVLTLEETIQHHRNLEDISLERTRNAAGRQGGMKPAKGFEVKGTESVLKSTYGKDMLDTMSDEDWTAAATKVEARARQIAKSEGIDLQDAKDMAAEEIFKPETKSTWGGLSSQEGFKYEKGTPKSPTPAATKEAPKKDTSKKEFKEGQIYTDAKGNRAMYNAGQWVPLK
jgi:hypothetical protein